MPLTPLNLTGTLNDNTVNLTWDSVIGASSYNVKRASTPGGPYTTIADNITTTNYTDSPLTTSDTIYYVVSAVNANGESENSNEVSITLSEQPIENGNGLLIITMVNGLQKEYQLSMSDINSFIKWYDGKSNGSGKAYYTFNKAVNGVPYKARKENIVFDKIMVFEVLEY
ncbi:MAG TPA: fibronectin type III domain-containing protein [Bacillus bacterium]|nr:fibronectin type III domain-containing protein [Bacillus sp. (in: firmicutes)]